MKKNLIKAALASFFCSVSFSALAATVPFDVIQTFEQSLLTQPVTQTFETSAAWQQFWKSHSISEAPEIDFRRFQVLAVATGQRPTMGYGLCVDKLESTASEIRVHLKTQKPDPDRFLPKVSHSVGCFVQVPRQAKSYAFVSDEKQPNQTPGSLPMRTLAHPSVSAILNPRKVVVRDVLTYQSLWKEHSLSGESPPIVDFSREMVIAVFLGEQATGGYQITIDGVEETDAALKVTTSVQKPAQGSMVIQMLTAPMHMITVKKSDLPVTF